MLAAGTANAYIDALMTAAAILAVWIVWYLAHQAWETFLTLLNLRHSARHPQPPPELNGVLDQATVTRSHAYLAARSRLNLLNRGLRAAPVLVVVATGALGALDQWLLQWLQARGIAAPLLAGTLYVVLLPLLILLMILTAAGAGMWLSALTIQYRDVKHAMTFVAQLLMYAAPVVWPVSLITDKFPEWGETLRLVYGLYPMAGVIEGFRASLLGTTPMPWDLIGIGTVSALVIAASGAMYFRRMERFFADVA